ncbi:hypothetical protein GGR52DRAFT_548574 [Hypoxylon sp. FL1284]|nr:hypothetical protein GGR52DRAFT_548574 [Hypoxylon sp. FL1284]
MSQQAQSGVSQMSSTPIPQPQPAASQSIQPSTITPASAPPSKRSRKSQESGSLQAGKRSTPNSMGSKNSMSNAATLDASRQGSQPTSAAQNHTQPEGLEAHYERIAALNRTEPTQGNSNRTQKQQQQPQHQATLSIGNTISPTPAEGLEAHYERFTALQNRADNTRPAPNRQQIQQQTAQTSSPVQPQTSKTSQMPSTLTHQQTRTPQNYYSQTQTLSSAYNPQAPAYSTGQRQPQHMATGSPGTNLVQHITNSPQFGAQSNSPLMQGDTNYRGSPSLVHNTSGYPPRRTPSASPLDTNYRTSSGTSHGVSNHSPHFGARQAPATTHSTSHPTMPSSFASFSDSNFLDIQSLDSGNNHGGLGLGTGSYGLSSGGVPSQQRTTGSATQSLYSPATGMNTNYMSSSNVGRASQNRWPS